jgi:TonB family protein
MRTLPVLALLSLSAAAAAAPQHKPVHKVTELVQPIAPAADDAQEHQRENAAAGDLWRAIWAGKAADVAARLDTPLDYADVEFSRDAACASKFHDHGYLKKKADVASFAACLTTEQGGFKAGTMRVALGTGDRIRKIWMEPEHAADDDPDAEVEGGVPDGVVGGQLGGIVSPDDLPPPPQRAKIVTAKDFDANRIAGSATVDPDPKTKAAIAASGKTPVKIMVKVCVDMAGAIAEVDLVRSSGFPAYDQEIKAAIRTWKYKPFVVSGAPTRACSVAVFIYPHS